MKAKSKPQHRKIYLSGTYVIEGVQSHYPIEGGSDQSANVTIRISSDLFEGEISTAKIHFENQWFRQSGDLLKEVVRIPEITQDGKVLYVFQPMSSLSVWLHMLTHTPRQSYYIDYGFEDKKIWAFVAPKGGIEHPIGK
jgi:hypothetical protein